MEVQVSRIGEGEVRRLITLVKLFSEVFDEDHSIASNENLIKLLQKPDFYGIIALHDGVVVGGLTAYEMQRYYNDKSELYIYDMAVKKAFHQKGIGKALILYLRNYCLEHAIENIFVEAHSEDLGAVKFYESTFGKSEKVDHFNLEIK